ncbi:hypothetical protein D3C72_2458990 [compost metagenome]
MHRLLHGVFAELEKRRHRQVPPAQAARKQVFSVIAHHVQEGIIGLENVTVGIPDHDPDDVGVYQAPDLRFALLDLAV